ncbi:MAG: NUDIX hydrolase, partial [Acidobacteriota bacterium]
PCRDPRGPTASAVYLCRATAGELAGGDDAASARWFADISGLKLAFDHARVLADAGFAIARRRASE